MQIYKVVSDDNQGMLLPDLIKIGQQHPDPMPYMEAVSDAKPLAELWINMEGVLEDKMPPGDIGRLQANHLSLSPKAKNHLEAQIHSYGELLPITYKGEQWYFFNLLNSIPAIDSESSLDPFSSVEAIAFHDKDIENQLLWTSPFGYDGQIFCSDQFIEVVETAGLTGLNFEKINSVTQD